MKKGIVILALYLQIIGQISVQAQVDEVRTQNGFDNAIAANELAIGFLYNSRQNDGKLAMQAKVFNDLSNQFREIYFMKVDMNRVQAVGLATRYGISTPTWLLFSNHGQTVYNRLNPAEIAQADTEQKLGQLLWTYILSNVKNQLETNALVNPATQDQEEDVDYGMDEYPVQAGVSVGVGVGVGPIIYPDYYWPDIYDPFWYPWWWDSAIIIWDGGVRCFRHDWHRHWDHWKSGHKGWSEGGKQGVSSQHAWSRQGIQSGKISGTSPTTRSVTKSVTSMGTTSTGVSSTVKGSTKGTLPTATSSPTSSSIKSGTVTSGSHTVQTHTSSFGSSHSTGGSSARSMSGSSSFRGSGSGFSGGGFRSGGSGHGGRR